LTLTLPSTIPSHIMKTLSHLLGRSRPHWVGNGFPVQTIFDYNHSASHVLSPFLLLDYAAPHAFLPGQERRGVGVHPHKGFETVTIVYQGELEHGDSTGRGGKIGPGDVQWMTAGRGILHEEFHSDAFTRKGGTLEMVQLWVNLRAADKVSRPGYQAITSSQIPAVSTGDPPATVRIIAGALGATHGPARTFTPMNVWDLSIESAGPIKLPVPEGHSALLLVLAGDAGFGHQQAGAGEMAVFTRRGDSIAWEASSGSRFLFLSGEPIDEPIVGSGPFVMNTAEEIRQAHDEFRAGNFGRIE